MKKPPVPIPAEQAFEKEMFAVREKCDDDMFTSLYPDKYDAVDAGGGVSGPVYVATYKLVKVERMLIRKTSALVKAK